MGHELPEVCRCCLRGKRSDTQAWRCALGVAAATRDTSPRRHTAGALALLSFEGKQIAEGMGFLIMSGAEICFLIPALVRSCYLLLIQQKTRSNIEILITMYV